MEFSKKKIRTNYLLKTFVPYNYVETIQYLKPNKTYFRSMDYPHTDIDILKSLPCLYSLPVIYLYTMYFNPTTNILQPHSQKQKCETHL